ncbi:MAG: Crp/Fnr family transcriptional regulator [Peptococcaceae bacterium]|nr:Crp/Fnr family transcriptional regulator [Peptococcaceae bacterium]
MDTSSIDLFPFLQGVEFLGYDLAPVKLSAGACAFCEGSASASIPLLLKGTIKVMKTAKSGREVLLYRVKPGQTCIIMLSSALGDIPYPATAIVEQDVETLMIPVELYQHWLKHNAAVQSFTYQSLALRLSSVMALVEEIVFKRIDIRLMRFLLEHTSDRQAVLYLTHEELAAELGTAREVVSRLLKNMEGEHLLTLARGKIMLIKRDDIAKILQNQ